MAGELWVSAFSLGGVVLGGVLAAFTQPAAQRSADRAEERRRLSATTELRRAEQVQPVKDFLARAQDAERAAYTRPELRGADEDGWMTRTQAVMTKLRTADRGAALLCDAALGLLPAPTDVLSTKRSGEGSVPWQSTSTWKSTRTPS